MGTYLLSITPPFREGERVEEEGCFPVWSEGHEVTDHQDKGVPNFP